MTAVVHTIQEAAAILRVPYRTARDAVFQGRWPHVKVSQRKRFLTDENILEVLDLLKQAPVTPTPIEDARATRAAVRDLLNAA